MSTPFPHTRKREGFISYHSLPKEERDEFDEVADKVRELRPRRNLECFVRSIIIGRMYRIAKYPMTSIIGVTRKRVTHLDTLAEEVQNELLR